MASATCGYCKRLTHLTLVTGPITKTWNNLGKNFWLHQAVFACDNCKNLSVAATTVQSDLGRDAEQAFEGMYTIRWQPQAVTWSEYEDVPQAIAEAAKEAHACASINAYRAAVLLTRAVIEATAKDKGITSGRLVDKIDKMAEQGLIRQGIAVAAHEVRYLGNDMAHGDFATEVAEVDAEDALTIMADVLREVFQSPAQIERMRSRRTTEASDTAKEPSQ